MRIYYFGELIEDTNETKKLSSEQTALNSSQPEKPELSDILGDLLAELDLSLDFWRPAGLQG